MQGRYPRTVREFGANQRQLVVRCEPCSRGRMVPNDVLEAAFGADFDLYDGYAALEAELRCDQCGKKHRKILFHDDTRYKVARDSTFEEALNRQLELRAYWKVRDARSGWPEPVKGATRRRR